MNQEITTVERNIPQDAWHSLEDVFSGEIERDQTTRLLYATDASVYQETPLAVAFPKSDADIRHLIRFARQHQVGLIARTAGTSLAGQVVGSGIVVDFSVHMNQILDVDTERRQVRVQPGVIRDELNRHLKRYGLLFGPETSTSNRAMIGGMVGNNSAGSNSIVYGSTRDQLLEVVGFLGTGEREVFRSLDAEQLAMELDGESESARIHREVRSLLATDGVEQEIRGQFPDPEIHRRNTGYALDALLDTVLLSNDDALDEALKPCNMSSLIAGSEGTLVIATEILLNCHPLPPDPVILVCPHFESVAEALRATLTALAFNPYRCELIDHLILEGASRNIEQQKNSEFVDGTPAAILLIELRDDDPDQLKSAAASLIQRLKSDQLGYSFPIIVEPDEQAAVWELRKAGLGMVANVVGDVKPVTVIEDTAVAPSRLADYISEIDSHLKEKYDVECVHYAHAGAGEIHLRPLINLKTTEGRRRFRSIATDVADIVKKFGGSLSGEHGDGRLRAEFLERMVGPKLFQTMKLLKQIFDPDNVLNRGKIVDPPLMDQDLRVDIIDSSNSSPYEIETIFDFSHSEGIFRATEMCSGSGDCRKSHLSGGTMCPSYMATQAEKDSTRGRANILRNSLANPTDGLRPLSDPEVAEVLDLCLSCKGCKNECPSNVDMARLKSEFMQHYQDRQGVSKRARRFADFARYAAMACRFSGVANWVGRSRWTSWLVKKWMGVHPARSLPRFAKQTFRSWYETRTARTAQQKQGAAPKVVQLFCDEFTNYLEPEIAIDTTLLLEHFGYEVRWVAHPESGRASLSKGLVRQAKEFANRNVSLFAKLVDESVPLIGIEPSAVLGFRDEYPDLVDAELREPAKSLARSTFLIDEFLARLKAEGKIGSESFVEDEANVKLHGHCHQKVLSSIAASYQILSLPVNYDVEVLKTGCCGMAGSFGMEREHYELSMDIGDLVLFPEVRKAPEAIIAATGTSCRHQILDGTQRVAKHPISILRAALRTEQLPRE